MLSAHTPVLITEIDTWHLEADINQFIHFIIEEINPDLHTLQ